MRKIQPHKVQSVGLLPTITQALLKTRDVPALNLMAHMSGLNTTFDPTFWDVAGLTPGT